MNTRTKMLALTIAMAMLPLSASAHKAWILPSQTVNSGTDPVVTFDAAVSNDLFYFNHVAMPVERISITAPDGSQVQAENAAKLKYRSVFDVPLKQQGTYRVASVNTGLNASWTENGQPKRFRGNAEDFAKQVPANAPDLKVAQSAGRVETFVTNGSPSAVKPIGQGLELTSTQHPNDMLAGQPTRFTLLLDGKPLPNTEVEIARGATRYRDALEEQRLKTDAKGEISVTFKEPGMYWIETTASDAKVSVPQAKERRLSYVVTLEVLPE